MKHNLHTFTTWWNNCFMGFSVSHDFKNQQMNLEKLKIWQKIENCAHQKMLVFVTISWTDL